MAWWLLVAVVMCALVVVVRVRRMPEQTLDSVSRPASDNACSPASSHTADGLVVHKYIPSCLILRSALYVCMAVVSGFVLSLRIETHPEELLHTLPSMKHYALLPDTRATLSGWVVRVLRRDSASVRCVVAGWLDTKDLPRLEHRHILLTIRRIPPQSPPQSTSLSHQGLLRAGAAQATSDGRLPAVQSGSRIFASAWVHLPRPALLSTDMDEERYAASLDVQWIASAAEHEVAVIDERHTLQRQIEQWREHLAERICELFPSSTEGFALALLTGDRSRLDPETRREYALAGTAHILAISGLHIGLLALVLLVPLGWLSRRRWQRWLGFTLFAVALSGVVILTGNAPSAQRAALMAGVWMLVGLLNREAHPANVVAFAALVMIVIEPTTLFSIGFQLSVAAVMGIALLYPLLHERIALALRVSESGWALLIVQSCALTASASSVASVLVAWYFQTYSLVAPVANLLVVPLSSAALMYGLATVSSSLLGAWLSDSWLSVVGECLTACSLLWRNATHGLLSAMDTVNHTAASWSWSAVQGVQSIPMAFVISGALVYCLSAGSRRLLIARCGAGIVLCVLALAVFKTFWQPNDEQLLLAKGRALIIPRQNVVAAVLPQQQTTVVILQDRTDDALHSARHTSLFFRHGAPDVGLERFLVRYAKQTEDSLIICTTSPLSLQTASRVASLLAQARPSGLLDVTVFSTSLQHKDPRQFRALDSLDALAGRGVRVVNAQLYLRRDSIVHVRFAAGIYRWNPHTSAFVPPGGKAFSIQTPIVLRRCREQITLPVHRQ
jgi:ComEC/Rec2-related protein